MSDRNKELISAIALSIPAIMLGACAFFGDTTFGEMSRLDTQIFCALWSLCCACCAIITFIGDRRLNDWINPLWNAYNQKAMERYKQRETMRAEREKDPIFVAKRKKRNLITAWIVLIIGPVIALFISIALFVYFRSEGYGAVLVVVAFGVIQIWALILKEYLQIKNSSDS